jgi:inorganic phosphate transporter, PiT family
MTGDDLVLVVVVIAVLGFDFTNGFHDTGNAMATAIATGALKPRVAVAWSGLLNLVGAFLSLNVAATIAEGLVKTSLITLPVVFGGLAGGILWNLLTWSRGLPSSSSHALIGGVVGASLVAAGSQAVQWHNLVAKVVVPAALAPLIAGTVSTFGTYVLYRVTRGVPERLCVRGFRLGQVGSASMVSLAHGTNDAQKTMGILTLALIVNHDIAAGAKAPTWVIVSCALAISLGTYTGGWRVIRTLGKGLVEIDAWQGMAAEASSAATILLSSQYGYSLSTTHVATGSIIGSGIGRAGGTVRWRQVRRMAWAWVVTLPAAGLVGAAGYALADAVGGTAGVIVDAGVLVVAAAGIYMSGRRSAVSARTVNADWSQSTTPPRSSPVAS